MNLNCEDIATSSNFLTCKFENFKRSCFSLYSEIPLHEKGDKVNALKKIHKESKENVKMYFKEAAPQMEFFVTSLRDFFFQFQNLCYAEWFSEIKQTVASARELKMKCRDISQLNVSFSTKFKKAEIDVQAMVKSIEASSLRRWESSNDFERRAWDMRMVYVLHIVNPFKSLTQKRQHLNRINEVKKRAKEERVIADINTDNICVAKRMLFPSLESIGILIDSIGGFFKNMNHELTSYTRDDASSKLRFQMLKGKAVQSSNECKIFYSNVQVVKEATFAITGGSTSYKTTP